MIVSASGKANPNYAPKRDQAYKLLSKKYIGKSSSYSRKHRQPAFEDTVHHVYVHHVHPIVLRQVKNKTIRHVIQPILHEIVEPERVVDEYVRAAVHREVHEEVDETVAQRIQQNRDILADQSAISVGDESHEEVHYDEEVEETHHDEFIDEIQPVIRRKVQQPMVLHETLPVFETVHRTVGVQDVITAAPMTSEEWEEAKTKKTLIEPSATPENEPESPLIEPDTDEKST